MAIEVMLRRATVCRGSDPDTGMRCPNPTTSASGYCPLHERRPGFGGRFRRTPTSPVHRSYRWRRLARRFREDWVRRFGWTCAGFRRPAHPSAQLAVDHIIAVSIDAARAYAWSNLRCLCPSCNARKSLSERRR